jgi:uncharacterized protein (DUF1800 family)
MDELLRTSHLREIGYRILPVGLVVLFVLCSAAAASADSEEDAKIRHLLQRATFGLAPGEVQQVRRIGRYQWIGQQVAPDGIADPALDAKLAVYPSLSMNSAELLANYPQQNRNDPQGIGPPGRILGELRAAQLTRAVHAKAQVREVLTDFWFNHFNVYAPTGPTRYTIVPYLRDAIRPHVLGRFEDLLRATATSPAMLYYLDNATSTAPGTRGQDGGINENYARELLELHTLGVDNGYAQEDIVEVARAFTGWTFTPARLGAYEFLFRARTHIEGDKTVMGQTIPSGDRSEGDQILAMLARHPNTAEFLATKLVRRFVADDPPPELVARARDVYLATDGNLAWVVAVILSDDTFYDPAFRGNKVKTPLEVVASGLRATGADVTVGFPAFRSVGDLGQPIMAAAPPTGWPERADEFLSSGGMVARFEHAYAIATGTIPNIEYSPVAWQEVIDFIGTDGLAVYILGRWPTPATSAALRNAARQGARADLLAALVLASPEFQLQ